MSVQPLVDPDDLAGAWQTGDADLIVGAAEALVRAYCGWHIYPSVTESVTVNGSGGSIQPLPTMYLTAVNSVTEATTDASGVVTTTTLTADVDYDWSQAGYLLRGYLCAWTGKLRGVVANITHGYDTLPAELSAVVFSIASRAQESSAGGGREVVGPFQFQPQTNSDGSVGGVSLTALEQSVLDRYRIPAQP